MGVCYDDFGHKDDKGVPNMDRELDDNTNKGLEASPAYNIKGKSPLSVEYCQRFTDCSTFYVPVDVLTMI